MAWELLSIGTALPYFTIHKAELSLIWAFRGWVAYLQSRTRPKFTVSSWGHWFARKCQGVVKISDGVCPCVYRMLL